MKKTSGELRHRYGLRVLWNEKSERVLSELDVGLEKVHAPPQPPGVLTHQAQHHFRKATRKDNFADGVELVENTELGLAQHQRVTSLQNHAVGAGHGRPDDRCE